MEANLENYLRLYTKFINYGTTITAKKHPVFKNGVSKDMQELKNIETITLFFDQSNFNQNTMHEYCTHSVHYTHLSVTI